MKVGQDAGVEPWELVAFALVGLAAGVLSGMFGVGGAVITTPGIRAFGVSPILAVGSTVPAILPAAIAGAWRYAKAGMVDWRVAWTCGLTGTAFAVGGAKVSDLVDARYLMVATAGLLLWSGVSSIRQGRSMSRVPATVGSDAQTGAPDPEVDRVDVPLLGLAAVGSAAGFLAGLLGVGGGIVMMPMFTNVLKLPVKVAVASSLVAVALFSVPAMITHALLGHIDWAVALALVVGTVPGARIGSHLALATADRTMRLLLGTFFCIIAVLYGGSELIGILA